MKRYYNGAALRGGWSFNQSSAITNAEVPDGNVLARDGETAFNACAPEVRERITVIANALRAGQRDVFMTIGYLQNMDALKMGASVMEGDQKKQLQARRVLLRQRWQIINDSPLYRKLQRVFHLPRDLARLRQPAMLEGPYTPYEGIEYFPTPPTSLKGTRNGQDFNIPLREARWSQLPQRYLDLPRPTFGQHYNDAEKAILRRYMQQAHNAIRDLRGQAAAAQPAMQA